MKNPNPKNSAATGRVAKAAVITAASIPSEWVPLSSLFLSPDNVRKAPTHIEALAESIHIGGGRSDCDLCALQFSAACGI